jgi:hypothetical protein
MLSAMSDQDDQLDDDLFDDLDGIEGEAPPVDEYRLSTRRGPA